MTDLHTLKAAIDLRDLVRETHPLGHDDKLCCLWHDDTRPSLHVYADGYWCFACGANGDHVDWLQQTKDLRFVEAVEELAHFAPTQTRVIGKLFRPEGLSQQTHFPISQEQFEAHLHNVKQLQCVPEALEGRGFSLADCKKLGIANEVGSAIFPIRGIHGEFLALKRRYDNAYKQRYDYVTPGHGTPAWCSPNIAERPTIFIIEGELNGMVCWLALPNARVGVMGTAGASGSLHLSVLKDKTVYIYADDDDAGDKARERWAQQAHDAGASNVFVMKPWSLDACDVAGKFGRQALRQRLVWTNLKPFVPAKRIDAVTPFAALATASTGVPSLSAKPELMQSCSPIEVLAASVRKPILDSSPQLVFERES